MNVGSRHQASAGYQQQSLSLERDSLAQEENLKIEYDLKRASKIQDIFQKYLKDDPSTSHNSSNLNRLDSQRESV
jgi:hypothetical protein